MSDESHIHGDCEEHACFVPTDRRRFLRDSFLAVAGAIVAVGMPKAAAFATPLDFTSAKRSVGDAHTYPVPAADGATVDKANEVILVRWQDAVYAFALSCPHQNTALKWDDRDHGFQCPKHHSRFQPDGNYIEGSGRATRNMDRFAVSRDATGITVNLDKLFQEDTDAAEWSAAVVRLK
jgi:nitrite reductase/ring-hydroxylating ferredoxin subunit